jgi:hypothetical protein
MVKNCTENFESGNNLKLIENESNSGDKDKDHLNFNFIYLKSLLSSNEQTNYDSINEDHRIQIETFTDNLMLMVENLLKILGKEFELQKYIDNGIEKKIGKKILINVFR